MLWAADRDAPRVALASLRDPRRVTQVCLKQPHLCALVAPPADWALLEKTQTVRNPWFFLQDYLLADEHAAVR